ncbi:MAG: TVP38/TMEM64 family protein [Verrucomicrobia bacterium]|nr:TVP38/TMEM64 family protein [Verrucomicrobiota bacterium]MBV8376031.1 TVP38/TMEM64 family protein [Verrucomicrobiota bacterium]
MTPPPSLHSSSATYHRVPWSLLVQGACLVLGLIVLFVASTRYPIVDWIGNVRESIQQLGFWSGLVYPITYAICNLLLLPGGVLSVGGGFFFGLWWGFLLVLAGNLLGAGLAFLIARKIGRQKIERLLSQNRRLQILDGAIERHGWKIVVLSQLNPLAPSSLLNYLYGLTRVRLSRCLLWVALGQSPGLFLYALIGTLGQFGVDMARGTRKLVLHDDWLWGTGFIVTIATTYLLGRLARRILGEAESEMTDRP